MSESTDIIGGLLDFLLKEKRLAYFNSSQTELTIRCPYCGDSTNNLNHGHMYIATHAPYSFFCQRCQTSGFLNRETLRDFEVDDVELTSSIIREVRKAIRNTTKTSDDLNSLLSGKRNLHLPAYDKDTSRFTRKLDYLEKRWGQQLSTRDLGCLKIITSYEDFIQLNNLKNLDKFYLQSEYHTTLRRLLNKYGIGFLSTDTNYTTFRYTKIPNNGRRYYTESHNRPLDIGNKVYTIRNDVDIFTPELNLVLAEGPLDIGSIYLNLYERYNSPDRIYGAVNGKAYKLFIMMLRRMGFLKINLDLYSDSEISLNTYRYMFNPDHFSAIRIHYNVYPGESDFGVPLNKIKVKTFKLK